MTSSRATPLYETLRKEILERGPLRFDRFQEVALYSPGVGYYERPGRVGRKGDFVTAPSWHPAFARCLLRFLSGLEGLGEDGLSILDVGAGEGELLRCLATEAKHAESRVALLGIERSTTRGKRAAAAAPGARLHRALTELPAPIAGLLIAYELFDALPVRALRVGDDGALLERLVTLDADERLAWEERAADDSGEILGRLRARGASPESGQLIEIRPGAEALAGRIAGAIDRGAILIFDYGAGTRALYGPARPFGTLEAFRRHEVTRDVLSDPGSRDITAWVDFDEVGEVLRRAGFDVAGPISQTRFLLGAGILGELPEDGPERPLSAAGAAERNAVAQLFLPGGMGESIRVLIATRGTKPAGSLAAFPASPGV